MRIALALAVLLAARPAVAQVPPEARQLVVVRAAGWSTRAGTLRRYAREPGGAWRPDGDAVSVSLGSAGLAWGRGLAPRDPERPPLAGPRKREGDGRTPAGIFLLGEATGIDPPPAGTRLAYRPAGDLVCVDDPGSAEYNRIVPAGGAWRSSEPMDAPVVYRRVIVVEHNAERVAGAGSCIFLHVWRAPGAPTAGCTAMDGAALDALLVWLDPERAPVLVVLPERAYRRLRARWRLP